MAIAYDATSTSATTGATSLTWSHTCSGSDRLLLVASENNGTAATGVTYNGVAMTKVRAGDAASGMDFWYLIAPATGANNIVVTLPSSNYIVAVAASYTGVKQTGFPDNSGIETYPADNGATEAISITPVADNCWVAGVAYVNANAATTAGSGTTIRNSNNNASGGIAIGDNNAAISPATSTTLNFVSSAAGRAAIICSIEPATASGPTNLKSLDTNVKANIKSYNTNVIANVKSINTNS